jgi:ABC-type sugar transport system ATPase subunit
MSVRAMPPEQPLLRMEQITKSFGASQVLKGVDLTVRAGEVRALVGQNGAGKSTLMKVLAGIHADHGGRVLVAGEEVELASPRHALAQGVAVIQQEFALVPQMTVAANIMLGREPGRVGPMLRPNDRELIELARREVEAWGLDLPLERPVSELSVAGQQMVEIVKALARRARLLVMDEPTARLSAPERERLFSIIRQLTEVDVGVIYISHFIDEVFRISDNVTVLRDGKVVADAPCAELDIGRLSTLMLGERLRADLATGAQRQTAPTGPPVLAVSDLACEPYFRGVSFALHPGEILGITGLVGSGRTRVMQTLAGVLKGSTGSIELLGAPYRPKSPGDAVDRGIAHVPEDRKRQGLVLVRSARDNIVTTALRGELSRFGFVRRSRCDERVDEYFERLQVRPPDPALLAQSFSGGNQQKLVIAKGLMVDPKVLLLDQPTAGVDIGSKGEIHRLIRSTAQEGRGIVVVSDDIDEVLAVSDRVLVMARGRLVAECASSEVSHSELLDLITQQRAADAA